MPQNPTPVFPEGTRFFVYQMCDGTELSELYHLVVTPTSILAFKHGFEKQSPEFCSYDVDRLNLDICLAPGEREWAEVTCTGFERVMRDRDNTFEGAPYMQEHLIHRSTPLYVRPPPTNHKIGAPKNKLP